MKARNRGRMVVVAVAAGRIPIRENNSLQIEN
jgi:hypothetical protein